MAALAPSLQGRALGLSGCSAALMRSERASCRPPMWTAAKTNAMGVNGCLWGAVRIGALDRWEKKKGAGDVWLRDWPLDYSYPTRRRPRGPCPALRRRQRHWRPHRNLASPQEEPTRSVQTAASERRPCLLEQLPALSAALSLHGILDAAAALQLARLQLGHRSAARAACMSKARSPSQAHSGVSVAAFCHFFHHPKHRGPEVIVDNATLQERAT